MDRWRRALVVALVVASSWSWWPTSTDAAGTQALRLLIARPVGEDGITSVHLTADGGTAFVHTKAELMSGLPPSDRFRVFAVTVATGDLRLVTDDWRVTPQAISGDGRLMVVSHQVDDQVQRAVLLDTSTGSPIMDLLPFQGSISNAVMSTDGSTAAINITLPDEHVKRLFVVDTATGVIDPALSEADGDLFHPWLSGDGSVLAFSSYADNLPVGVGNNGSDAVVFDRTTGTMQFAYTTNDGDVANDQSVASGISADGSSVIVQSWATNFDGPPSPLGGMNIFQFQRSTGATTSIMVEGPDTPDHSSVVAMTADGSKILVISFEDTVRLVDIATRSFVDVTNASDGTLANAGVYNFPNPAAMSADGTVVAFISRADNIGSDADDVPDAFVWGAPGSAPPSAVPTTVPSTTPVPISLPMPVQPIPVAEPATPADGQPSGIDGVQRWACSPVGYLPGLPLACRDSTDSEMLLEVLSRFFVRSVLFDEF